MLFSCAPTQLNLSFLMLDLLENTLIAGQYLAVGNLFTTVFIYISALSSLLNMFTSRKKAKLSLKSIKIHTLAVTMRNETVLRLTLGGDTAGTELGAETYPRW